MKLLAQTARYYILLATTLLVLGVPALYFALRSVLIQKLDSELREHKNSFFQSVRLLASEEDLNVYKHFYEEFSLNEVPYKIKRDSIFTTEMYDSAEGKITPYRVLRSGVYLNGKNYELLIRESLITTQELILIILLIKAGILASLLTGLVLINQKMTKNVFAPFYLMVRNLKQFKIDRDTSFPKLQTNIDEFKELNNTLVQLTKRNRQSYISQKEFTENAAHELQTPLAIIRTKLELLMQSSEMNTHQAELIGELYAATDRINRLNKNLLLLSQIESSGKPESEPVDLQELISKILNQYTDFFQNKNIRLTNNAGSATWMTNSSMMEILISNLVLNAAKFTPPNGLFHIHIADDSLVFSNTGDPLQNPDKIFNRFHRQSTQKNGFGLGLTICKQICSVLECDLQYEYINKRHTFKVTAGR